MHILNRVKLNTPESVELELILAGIGNRVLAFIIDYQILALTIVLFLLMWTFIASQFVDVGVKIFGAGLGLWIVAIAIFSLFVIYTSYFVFFETLWQGQTIGKRIAKIRVVSDDGKPIGLREAALRALLRPVDEFLFIGVLLILLYKREKRLGDFVAGTIVIQTGAVIKSAKIIISDQAKSFHLQLREIGELAKLLPDDFVIIREYLCRRNSFTSKARALVSLRLAEQVQNIIYLETLPADISADVFLEAIYLAYQRGGTEELLH